VGKVAQYQPSVYGDTELGGTQVMYLSGVPFDKLGLPTNVPDYAYAAITEGIQHTLYKWFALPMVMLSGLLFTVHRNTNKKDQDEEEKTPSSGGEA
jgi:hypothetical protein